MGDPSPKTKTQKNDETGRADNSMISIQTSNFKGLPGQRPRKKNWRQNAMSKVFQISHSFVATQ